MFVLYILVILLNHLASIYAKNKAEKLLNYPYIPLPDIIQENLPTINTHVPDCVLVIICLYVCIFVSECNDFYINVHCLLYSLFIRPIFVCATTLPTCMPPPSKKQSYYTKLFLSTHDLMFSGHTCMFIFLGKIIGGYIGMIIQYLFPILLVMSRQHYTIDVLVSMLVYNYFSHNHIY